MTNAKQNVAVRFALVLSVFLMQIGHAQKRPCTKAEGRRALDEAVMQRSWDTLYRSFKSYRQCDDGAISEGFSESVARVLVDHWKTLPQLARLAGRDSQFRVFVTGHIDAALDMNDVKKIRRNARTQCPTGLRTVCDDLTRQAASALKEDATSP
jgi:hypothetical protein